MSFLDLSALIFLFQKRVTVSAQDNFDQLKKLIEDKS